MAIDVNSGGATKRNIEKTALKTNMTAEEIAKQIKIRDLSGLIVIDFIDMYEMRNNRRVERKMKELLKKDRQEYKFLESVNLDYLRCQTRLGKVLFSGKQNLAIGRWPWNSL